MNDVQDLIEELFRGVRLESREDDVALHRIQCGDNIFEPENDLFWGKFRHDRAMNSHQFFIGKVIPNERIHLRFLHSHMV